MPPSEHILKAKKTNQGYCTGVNIYNIFASTKKLKTFDQLTMQDNIAGISESFAEYMISEARTKHGDWLTPGTSKQYFSNWYNALVKEARFNGWVEQNWYSGMCKSIYRRCLSAAMGRGEVMKMESLTAIRRDVFVRMIEEILVSANKKDQSKAWADV